MTDLELTQVELITQGLHNSAVLINQIADLAGPGHDSNRIIQMAAETNSKSIREAISFLNSIQ